MSAVSSPRCAASRSSMSAGDARSASAPRASTASKSCRRGAVVAAQPLRVDHDERLELRQPRADTRAPCRPAPGPRRRRTAPPTARAGTRPPRRGWSGRRPPSRRRPSPAPSCATTHSLRFSLRIATWPPGSEAEPRHAEAEVPREPVVVGPRVGLPDAEVLLPECNAVGPGPGPEAQPLRQGGVSGRWCHDSHRLRRL